jgi:lysophospholipase L1-like esterase
VESRGVLGGSKLIAATGFSLVPGPEANDMQWHDVTSWGVEGRGFNGVGRFFDRLPADAQGKVPESVWELSHHAAGMAVHFDTDATAIHLRYGLLNPGLAMPHMPATGVSGMDLYGLDEMNWRWAAVFKPTAQQCEGPIIEVLESRMRRWRLYLPLYNGVESLSIGVPSEAKFVSVPPREQQPIVFYGTSILHGACASRPGMAWPAIVGRRLDVPTINLGFSGSGKMEASVVERLARIDAAAFVIDCAPNMSAREITNRTVPLVQTLRAARPHAAIVLVEDRRYSDGWIHAARREKNDLNARALRAAHEVLVASGITRLGYVEAAKLLGVDGQDGLTDGSHPNDHGMLAYADALTPELAKILGFPAGR